MELALLDSPDALFHIAPAIRSLAADTLQGRDSTCLPDYFLPRLSETHRPRVVACYEGGRLAGVVYTEERLYAGLPTGWIFGGDAMGRGLVLASPEREAEVVATACEHLIRQGAHAIRLCWRATGNEALPVLRLQRRGVQVWCRSELRAQGDWLHLGPSYDAFLARLGPHTRRNLRHARRRAEEHGIRFLPQITLEDYETAVARLSTHADEATLRSRDQRDRRYFSQSGTPLLAGLADARGRLLAVVAGVRADGHIHLLSQFNDTRFKHSSLRGISLSLALRAWLIEQLTDEGFTAIHFVNGASGALSRYCDPVLLRSIAIDNRRSLLHPAKAAAAHAARRWQRSGRWVPRRVRNILGSYLASF